MKVLRTHYEKIILGLFLVGLLASCYYLLHSLKVASRNVEDVEKLAEDALRQGDTIKPVSQRDFPTASAELDVRVAGMDGHGGLFEPSVYIVCLNPDCRHLLRIEKTPDGSLKKTEILPVAFVPLVSPPQGEAAGSDG